ncbi:hypothetical protein [Hoylesella saccharolytica]|uniref:hypothetical protein n=1 Tax=Hoylesella saccharolytica TaxID=633701 RepID=UPI00205636CF|nr:hypothetical protein [Hoylesella saccharolytica]DAR82675.1 MAG TPA: hypothetical protein [Bacteriophage sp.]DAT23836.1 MAG TPA: hypothetical protein [Caudoviricetes sp.]
MKHLLYILLLLVLASCRTTRTVTHEQETTIQQRDSVVLRDSVVIRYITATRDSIVIRDSVVIIKDTTGRVIGTERYRTSDRVRDRVTDNATTAKRTESRDNIRKEQSKSTKTDSKSVRFSITSLVRVLGLFILFALITTIVLKAKRLWKWW